MKLNQKLVELFDKVFSKSEKSEMADMFNLSVEEVSKINSSSDINILESISLIHSKNSQESLIEKTNITKETLLEMNQIVHIFNFEPELVPIIGITGLIDHKAKKITFENNGEVAIVNFESYDEWGAFEMSGSLFDYQILLDDKLSLCIYGLISNGEGKPMSTNHSQEIVLDFDEINDMPEMFSQYQ